MTNLFITRRTLFGFMAAAPFAALPWGSAAAPAFVSEAIDVNLALAVSAGFMTVNEARLAQGLTVDPQELLADIQTADSHLSSLGLKAPS